MNAEVDTREGDEEARENESRCEGRVDGGEGYGAGAGGRRVTGGKRARGGRLDEGGYLGVVDKGTGAVEEELGALGDYPGDRDGGPGHEEVVRLEAGREVGQEGERSPPGNGPPPRRRGG